MEVTSISRLKASLSQFLDMIKKGEIVIITDRGKAFAKISPLENDSEDIPLYMAELERAGLAHIGTGKIPDAFWDTGRPALADNAGVQAVLDERESSL